MNLEHNSIIGVWLAYYAAYIDGEGHIGIKKYDRWKDKGFSPTYSERVSVASTNKMIIESFNDIVKGHIYLHKGSKLSTRGYWSWEVTDRNACYFLKQIRPYLKVKGLQADILLALGRNKEKNKRKRISDKDLKLREDFYIITKLLHKI